MFSSFQSHIKFDSSNPDINHHQQDNTESAEKIKPFRCGDCLSTICLLQIYVITALSVHSSFTVKSTCHCEYFLASHASVLIAITHSVKYDCLN